MMSGKLKLTIGMIALTEMRQRADCGSTRQTLRINALTGSVNRQVRHRRTSNRVTGNKNAHAPPGNMPQPHQPQRSNPHSPKMHCNELLRCRGFLPWVLSVACF